MKWSKAQLGWNRSWKFLDSMEPAIKEQRKKPRTQAKDTQAAMDRADMDTAYKLSWSFYCAVIHGSVFIADFPLASYTSSKFSQLDDKSSTSANLNNDHGFISEEY